ncbi:MAG TPA: hypothetical protein VK610_04950 [Rhodothermales bacterium]|nr:hypothetical protein [Rhodothermales bacterium]
MDRRLHSIDPIANALEPEIEIVVSYTLNRDRDLILGSGGTLWLGDLKIADVREAWSERQDRVSGRTKGWGEQSSEFIRLRASLSPRALEAVERSRESEPHSDVMLRLDLGIRIMKISASNTEKLVAIHQNQEGAMNILGTIVAIDKNDDYIQDVRILAIFDRENLVELDIKNLNIQMRIASSDWINKFSSSFGKVKYIISEYPVISYDRLEFEQESLYKRMDMAVSLMNEATSMIQAGEWRSVIVACRKFSELLRNQNEHIRKILEDDGLPADAADDLISSLKGIFDYASKFVHITDKEKQPRASIHVSREDALLIYGQSTAILNLIVTKIRRHIQA